MDTPTSSDLLQSRLRERKAAESAKMSAQRPFRNAEPDDAVFDHDPVSPTANMSKVYHSSPVDAPRRAANQSASRRGSNTATKDAGNPRAMGAREMEGYVDKLTKQNFDLKLEIYHRRQKMEELEKKVEVLDALEREHTEMMDVNEDLLRELEKRDVAIDEAVVMICELEERIRQLTEHSASEATLTNKPPVDATSTQRSAGYRTKSTPSKNDDQSARARVSPEVSARMHTLSKPPHAVKAIRPPSFLQDNQPSTYMLRQLFVDGDRSVRPIPSYASLLSRRTAMEEDDLHAEILKSPRLSMLSESDLKSLYQPEDDVFHKTAPLEAVSAPAPTQRPATPKLSAAQERSLARVDRWIDERALSPAPTSRSRRAPHAISKDSAHFQSLGNVLHLDEAQQPEAPTTVKKTQRRPSNHGKSEADATLGVPQQSVRAKKTPPMLVHPVFGQTYFPPTPDTMVTQSLNRSTSSIVQERSNADGTVPPPKNFTSLSPMIQPLHVASPQARSAALARHSILPQEVEAYEDNEYDDFAAQHRRYGSFSHAIASDESTSDGSPPRFLQQSTTRSSHSPELLFKSTRRPSRHAASQPRPPQLLRTSTEPSMAPEPMTSPTSAFPAYDPTLFEHSMRTSLADTASLLPASPTKDYATRGRAFPPSSHSAQTPRHAANLDATTPIGTVRNPPSAFQPRATTLRDRVARFTRRNSSSSANGDASGVMIHSETATPTHPSSAMSGAEDGGSSGQPSRRRSLKQRIFRRSSSAHEAVSTAHSSSQREQLHATTGSDTVNFSPAHGTPFSPTAYQTQFFTPNSTSPSFFSAHSQQPPASNGSISVSGHRPQTAHSTGSKKSMSRSIASSNTSGGGLRAFAPSFASSSEDQAALSHMNTPVSPTLQAPIPQEYRSTPLTRGRSTHASSKAYTTDPNAPSLPSSMSRSLTINTSHGTPTSATGSPFTPSTSASQTRRTRRSLSRGPGVTPDNKDTPVRGASANGLGKGQGRKRFSFSGKGVSSGLGFAAAAVAAAAAVGNSQVHRNGYDNDVAGTGTSARERSGSMRLREVDATGAGKWM